MSRLLIVVLGAVFVLASQVEAQSSCAPGWNIFNTNTDCLTSCTLSGYVPGNCPLCKEVGYNVTFPDGYSSSTNLSATGAYNRYFSGCTAGQNFPYDPATVQCWPPFQSPKVSNGLFSVTAQDDSVTVARGSCGLTPYNIYAACTNPGPQHTATVSHTCPSCPMPPPTQCSQQGGIQTCQNGQWVCSQTPIVIDVEREGFHLTSLNNGVQFRMVPGGPLQQMSWTDANWHNGWLALDRNDDGAIDDFTELFGNFTAQPPSNDPNGFLALAVFDDPANGGNGNGVIDPGDSVYSSLRVWIDANHNGVSEPYELHTLQELGILRSA